jgi:hypothetical protein
LLGTPYSGGEMHVHIIGFWIAVGSTGTVYLLVAVSSIILFMEPQYGRR